MITAGSIKVYSHFFISNLLDMEIETKEGCHSKLALRGFLLEGENRTELPKDTIMITGKNEEGNEEILFRGIIQETHIFHENGISQIILTAASESMQMDKQKRSRSFQDTSLSCAEVMRSIVSKYGGTMVCEDSPMKIGEPMVQYEETDWEFCKRLAGKMGWGLFGCSTAAKPAIHVGLVEGKKIEFSEEKYHCCVDSEYYRHREKGDIQRAEFLYYKIESERNCEIGDCAWYRQQKRYVFEKRAELKDNVLKFSYKLGGKCRVMRREQPNKNIAGVSLSGEVIKNEKETVYVKLDIDGKNGKAVYPYPWSPATGNLVYCMPQLGTKVYLYFPDCYERNVIAVHSKHQSSSGFGNIQNRGLATEHGKQMQLHADSMSFRSKTAKGEQLIALGLNNLKIEAGHGQTVITGKEKITFCAPVISLITPREISQYKVEGYALEREKDIQPKGSRNPATGGDSCFSVQFEFNGFAKQGVMVGTQYEKYFAFKDAPTYEKDYATGWKILAGIVTAVVVGLAIGALVFATGGVAAAVLGVTVTQLAVGTGVITAGAGILATAGTYFNDKRNGTTSSLSDYMSNSYTASVSVGGSLAALYLSLTGAEAITYMMTGGSIAVPIFGTVISTKSIMSVVMMASAEITLSNVAFQLDDLAKFLAGEKPLRALTGNPLYDTSKGWIEMLSAYIATYGMQNPRSYGPTYEKLPDVTVPAATNAGASGSTALATQNTGLVNAGGRSGAGLLPQMNMPVIPSVGSSATYPVGGGRGGTVPVVKTQKNVEMPILPEGSQWERNVLNSFAGGKSNPVTYGGGTTLYRVGGKNGGFWSLDPPPATEYQWRVDFAIKQEFCNDASTLYKMTIPEGSSLSGLEGTVGTQGMGLYGGAHQVYIDYRAVPSDWIEILPTNWK